MNLIVEVGNRELLTGKKGKKAGGCVSRFFQQSDRRSIDATASFKFTYVNLNEMSNIMFGKLLLRCQ
ncbi:hypothetical protein NIES4074_22570 [Cylindrospermum sp. NIES-4074]|nr:hypothetical protein NIES4074_22570 [Cylindrospermum sp. NIES-4074]